MESPKMNVSVLVMVKAFLNSDVHFQHFMCEGLEALLKRRLPAIRCRVVLSADCDTDVVVQTRGELWELDPSESIEKRILLIVRTALAHIAEGTTTKEGEAAQLFIDRLQDKIPTLLNQKIAAENTYQTLAFATATLISYGFGNRCSREDALLGLANADDALKKASSSNCGVGGLCYEKLESALANIGYDLTCGQCASVFYTGAGDYKHADNCRTLLVITDALESRK